MTSKSARWWIVGYLSVLLVYSAPAHAQSSTSQADIQTLLAQIQILRSTLAALSSSATTPASSKSCPTLARNLSKGSRGEDVRTLQWFLVSEGVLTSESTTGLYGKWTEIAVQDWQKQKGIVSSGTAATTGYGAVGSRTRSAIALSCGRTAVYETDALAVKREQVIRARESIESGLLQEIQKLYEKIRLYPNGDTPNVHAFAYRHGERMRNMYSEYMSLDRDVHTASASALDHLLERYAQLQNDKQIILAAYNTLPMTELDKIVAYAENTTMSKSRDARRISDIKQLQLALELYYDAHGSYPVEPEFVLVSEGFIAALPRDPLDGTSYPYDLRSSGASYLLGADLETANHSALQSDVDAILSDTNSCRGVPGRYCYDVTP